MKPEISNRKKPGKRVYLDKAGMNYAFVCASLRSAQTASSAWSFCQFPNFSLRNPAVPENI
jgi:hypothetical protein